MLTSLLPSFTHGTGLPRHAPNMYVDWPDNGDYDVMTVDWYCEQDAINTYWAVHNWEGGYAGFQNVDGNHVLLMSLWDLDNGIKPTIEYSKDDVGGEFGGEGTGKQVFTNYRWEPGKWYTMRVQVWTANGKSYFGQWVCEEGGELIKTAVISYPVPDLKFNKDSMFQEDFTFNNLSRKCRLKNAYGRFFGTTDWDSWSNYMISNTYFPTSPPTWDDVTWNVNYDCDWGIADDNSYVWVQSGGSDFTSNGKTAPVTYRVNQGSKPAYSDSISIDESKTPSQYIGIFSTNWEEDRDTNPDNAWTYGVDITDISNGQITFSIFHWGNYWSPVSESDIITADLVDNIAKFNWYAPSWDKRGTGILRLQNGNVIINAVDESPDRGTLETRGDLVLLPDPQKSPVIDVQDKSDEWVNLFAGDSYTYNHEIATIAIELSDAAYDEDMLYQKLSEYGFHNSSFSPVKTYNYDNDGKNANGYPDIVGYTFTSKEFLINGERRVLNIVVVRGTPQTDEWFSNFDIGYGNEPKGFAEATRRLYDDLKEYLNRYELLENIDKNIFLVTGHSRGAAVANLLSARLNNEA